MALKLKDETLLRAEAYVGGVWKPAKSGNRFPVTNPATGETLTQVANTLQTKTTMTVVNDVTHSSHPTAGAQASQAKFHPTASGVLGYNYAVLAYNYSGIYTATHYYAYMAYSYAKIGNQTGDLSKYNVAMQYAYAAWVYAAPNSYAATLARTAYVNLYWASKGF